MLIFAERHKCRVVHDAALFSWLCESGISRVGCLTSLPFFFPVAETRNWHQDVVITRGVHFSASPDRAPRRPLDGRWTWSLRTTNKALLETNRDDLASAEQIDTPPIVHVRLTDHGVLFSNLRLIHFSLLVC